MTRDSYTSLEQFPLGWRFEATRITDATNDVVRRLRPLDADGAARLAERAAERSPDGDAGALAFRSDDPPGAVRDRLRALPVDAATEITLSWDRRTALCTEWAIFVAHWDDFCYPASDDVVIWAVEGRWTLRYHHYEVFQFWEAEGTASDAGRRAGVR